MSIIRWIFRKGILPDNWFGHMVAALALPNKVARIIWAIMTTSGPNRGMA